MSEISRGLEIEKESEIKEALIIRAKVYNAIRKYLDNQGFIEIETPILSAYRNISPTKQFQVSSEKDNKPVGWLRTMPEHYAIRLLNAFDKIYELGRDFRDESPDAIHNPEFTVIEIYQKGADWKDMMNLTENLIEKVALDVIGTTKVNYSGEELELRAPWNRTTLRQAILYASGIDIYDYSDQADLEKIMREKGIIKASDNKERDKQRLLYKLSSEVVEPRIIQPTFITEHPADWPWSSKISEKDPRVRDQTEVIFGKGIELANIYTLNTDSEEIIKKDIATIERNKARNVQPKEIHEDFYSDLGGLKDNICAESAIGLDRLIMLLTNKNIAKTLAFPYDRR